jgi:hypothetical protein
MNPFIKFLTSARSLASQGITKDEILAFAEMQFGKIGTKGLLRKQIDNIFKPKKPVGKKDPDFDNTVEKMQFDDQGKPFNPRDPLKKADGGRIGYAMGSEGIMQVAEADEITNKELNVPKAIEIFERFNERKPKDIKELLDFFKKNPRYQRASKDEGIMQMASAPDPMDERNMVMENIAISEFGKPLKDLGEDEIIQIEEMMEEMTKIDRGAPSITLADGGRAEFKDGTFKKLFFNEKTPILSGLNTTALFDLVVAAKDLVGPAMGLADGGRIEYKDGPKDPRRRGFMKAAVGIASMLPFGIGKGVKMAKPAIEKAVDISGPALAKIVETVMSLGKTISISGKRVKEMITKKKHKDIEVEEDIMDGSYTIKKGNKEIYFKPGRQDEMGIEDDIIEVFDKTVTKKAGGGVARLLGE